MPVGFLATVTSRSTGDTATFASIAADNSDPLTFANAMHHRGFLTSGATESDQPIHIDLTDGDGNGMLIATDRLFIVGANVAGTVASSFTAKIKYRQTNVGVMEYIGIVQSQQG